MAIVIQDNFTEAVFKLITAHMPNIGGAWVISTVSETLSVGGIVPAPFNYYVIDLEGDDKAGAVLNASPTLVDCYAQLKVRTMDGDGNEIFIILREDGSGNGLALHLINNVGSYIVTLSGSYRLGITVLKNLLHIPVVGSTYKISIVGTLVSAYKDDVLLDIVNCFTLLPANLKTGIGFRNDTLTWWTYIDDFEAGSIEAPVPTNINYVGSFASGKSKMRRIVKTFNPGDL